MTKDRSTRIHAVDTLLERGVRFRLPAPLLSRLLGRNWVTIRPLKAGTILECARAATEGGLDDPTLFVGEAERMTEIVEACARCIAIAALNDKRKIERNAEKLTHKLMWAVSAESIVEIYRVIRSMWRVEDFTSITILMTQLSTMMLIPKMGHKRQGS